MSRRRSFAGVVFVCLSSALVLGGCGGRGAAAGITTGPVDADAPEAFTTTKSGLRYRTRRASGGYRPKPSDTVKVHYHGWLDDGTVFDSSYKRGQPAEFQLSNVVAGWTEGLQLIGTGGMIELDVPPELGYGAQQKDAIPANSRLHFLVELFDVPMPSSGQ